MDTFEQRKADQVAVVCSRSGLVTKFDKGFVDVDYRTGAVDQQCRDGQRFEDAYIVSGLGSETVGCGDGITQGMRHFVFGCGRSDLGTESWAGLILARSIL